MQHTPLTKNEWETVEAIPANKVTYAELAIACCVSIHGMNARISRIYTKTGARSMAELILMATGLVWCPIPLPSGRTEVARAA